MKGERIIVYEDELNDEFSGSSVKPKVIDSKYKYIIKNPIYKLLSFITYRLIATPIAYCYKLFNGVKFVNKKILKDYKGKGYFIYANHTNKSSDVLMPHMITFPKKIYTIVNSCNMNIPFIGNGVRTLGAMPIPTGLDGTRNFLQAIEKRSVEGNPILIYPEAHIWPYYTKIRNFSSSSFKFPVKFSEPSFCFTTTYQKRKRGNKPRIVIYVDGPFYPKEGLSIKEQQEDLRNQIYACMEKRSKNNNVEMIKYIKQGEETND